MPARCRCSLSWRWTVPPSNGPKGTSPTRWLLLVAALGVFLLAAVAVQVQLGLRPLTRLGGRLNAMRGGRADRLAGRFPAEIQQLVDELNGLLAVREAMVADARARASDLAHGLKTPLSILAAESRRLAADGAGVSAAEIDAQIERMNRTVERELARARVRGRAGALAGGVALAEAVDRLLGAFARMTEGAGLSWEAAVPSDLTAAMDPADLDEVLGNLCDNARKWARGRIRITAVPLGDGLRLTVEDDGPGIPPAGRSAVLARGGRLDESAPGTGLGLTIVRDILDRYDGTLDLSESPLGGLRVALTLPADAASANLTAR